MARCKSQGQRRLDLLFIMSSTATKKEEEWTAGGICWCVCLAIQQSIQTKPNHRKQRAGTSDGWITRTSLCGLTIGRMIWWSWGLLRATQKLGSCTSRTSSWGWLATLMRRAWILMVAAPIAEAVRRHTYAIPGFPWLVRQRVKVCWHQHLSLAVQQPVKHFHLTSVGSRWMVSCHGRHACHIGQHVHLNGD